LNRIAGRVVEKHCGLLTHLPDEADAGFDLEADSRCPQAVGERAPRFPLEHHTEMWHRHVLPVDSVVMHVWVTPGIEVHDELVAEKIEVDPLVAAAAFLASEQGAVELTRIAQRVDRDREMKWLWHPYFFAHHSSRALTARSG
jgi:hypothetical protein